jgi:hypothetical protein
MSQHSNTRRFLELNQNPGRDNHHALVSERWFAVFSFADSGYVKDDEKQHIGSNSPTPTRAGELAPSTKAPVYRKVDIVRPLHTVYASSIGRRISSPLQTGCNGEILCVNECLR